MQTFTHFLFGAAPLAFLVFSITSSCSTEKRSDENALNNAAICLGCKESVVFLRTMYGQNRSQDFLIQVASFICRHFVHEDSSVCYGLSHQFREEILYVVDKLILQPDTLCSLFIQNCGYSGIDTSTWNITLPTKRPGQKYPIYPILRPNNLRVLHITDLHLDFKYQPGSEANCSDVLCCHAKPRSNESMVNQKSGYWGSIAACDIPYWTVDNMLQNIRKLEQIDYIIVGGDYESHMDWTYTKNGHLETIRNLSGVLKMYFPDTPIYWTLGNHEGVPIDSFAPHYIPKRYRQEWLYDELWQLQKSLLDEKSEENVKYRGSYAAQIYPGLKIISLNSGYCETLNFWLYINETDPDGTLSWLVSELEQAELDGQYVHILSHVPPGDNECFESWARNYYKIVTRFSKTIMAQFFGHIHVDSFTVFYENMNDDWSKPLSVLYASPSVTTFKNLNPAFRIYDIEAGIKYRVVNFHTYFLNLSKAEWNTMAPRWELLYSAKEEYNLKDLSPLSLDQLINRIVYEKKIYNKFIRNSNRQDNFVCEGKCRLDSLCFLRKGHHNATLCNHIQFQDNRHVYSYPRNPYKFTRPSDDFLSQKMKLTSAGKEKLLRECKDLLSKKLRAHVLKQFIKLFLLTDEKVE